MIQIVLNFQNHFSRQYPSAVIVLDVSTQGVLSAGYLSRKDVRIVPNADIHRNISFSRNHGSAAKDEQSGSLLCTNTKANCDSKLSPPKPSPLLLRGRLIQYIREICSHQFDSLTALSALVKNLENQKHSEKKTTSTSSSPER